MVNSINEVVVGGVYSYVNPSNYVIIEKVQRVTGQSVFSFNLLNDGKFASKAHRQSFNSFKKYTYQPNYK